MMRLLTFIFISLCLSQSMRCQEIDGEAQPDTTEFKTDQPDILRSFNEKIQSCTNETGISIAQRAKIFGNDYSDDSKEVKCFIRCFWMKLGFMDENEKIIRDKFAESLSHVNIGRGSDLVDVDRIMDKCLAIETDDPCDFAYDFLKCYYFDDEFFRASAEIEANRVAADAEAAQTKDEL